MTVPPVVAIVAGRYPDDRYSSHRGYIDAVLAVGGVPLIVPAGPGAPPERYAGLLEGVRALVLTGGGDVEPAVYGGGGHPEVMEVDPDRDTVDLYLARAAIARGIPVLGICRDATAHGGLGGTLAGPALGRPHGHWQEDLQYDRSTPSPTPARWPRRHCPRRGRELDPPPGRRRSGAAGAGDLSPTASSRRSGRRRAGVQWHPERLLGHVDRHLAPFRWVVAA
jgi:putative glutamine amidotransferase